jgi:hypothetical protein
MPVNVNYFTSVRAYVVYISKERECCLLVLNTVTSTQ